MTLPTLNNWEATRDALHQVALALGAIRVACVDPMPNDLHFSVDLAATGPVATGLNIGGELQFRLADLSLAYCKHGQDVFSVSICGHSQISLMQELRANFAARGVSIEASMKHVTHETDFDVDRGLATDYLDVLEATYTALARFRGKLGGYLSPIVLWPHHFDVAFLYFPGPGTEERSDPQLAFGFAPFSDGLDRPYYYAYGWSPAAGYVDIPVESPARANRDGYTGLYAAYDDLRRLSTFNESIEAMLLAYAREALEAL